MIVPKLIGIVGGSGSGKTTFAQHLLACTSIDAIVLSQDNYYKGLGAHESPFLYNFDHPDALELDEMKDALAQLKEGFRTSIPVYDFVSHKRSSERINIDPPSVIIAEGLFLFSHEGLRDLFDLKLFFDVSVENRLDRRLGRDLAMRGRSRDEVLWRFQEHCEAAYRKFILPSAKYADLKITPTDGFGSSYDKQIADVIDLLLGCE